MPQIEGKLSDKHLDLVPNKIKDKYLAILDSSFYASYKIVTPTKYLHKSYSMLLYLRICIYGMKML